MVLISPIKYNVNFKQNTPWDHKLIYICLHILLCVVILLDSLTLMMSLLVSILIN